MLNEDNLLLPDKCWKPKYGNDSRKWLLSQESNLEDIKRPASAMKEQYRPPASYGPERKDGIAKRKEKINNKFIQEALEEIEDEYTKNEESIDYSTTYVEKFQIPGFKLDDNPPEDIELFLKYPLYTSTPVTVWTDRMNSITGMSKITDSASPFKRNGNFTTPISQQMYEI